MLMGLSRVRVSGPLSAFATGFADHLTRQGYSPRQTRLQLLLLNHLSNWLASEGLVVGELRAKEVEQFQLSRDEGGLQVSSLYQSDAADPRLPARSWDRTGGFVAPGQRSA